MQYLGLVPGVAEKTRGGRRIGQFQGPVGSNPNRDIFPKQLSDSLVQRHEGQSSFQLRISISPGVVMLERESWEVSVSSSLGTFTLPTPTVWGAHLPDLTLSFVVNLFPPTVQVK